MYDPIYSQNIGLCGFRCRVVDSAGKSCTRVVRTYRGIVMHCKRKHGLVAQMELFDAPVQAENQDGVMTSIAKENKNGEEKQATDVEHVRAERTGGRDANRNSDIAGIYEARK